MVAADHSEAGRVELWFMDEARIGQKGRVTHVWYQKGVRPRGLHQQGFASAHLFGAVCPERDAGVALAMPEVSTAAMGLFLAELSRSLPAGTHAALVLYGAGWHVSPDLEVPTTRAELKQSCLDGDGEPQLLLRLGWAPVSADPVPPTGRLRADQI